MKGLNLVMHKFAARKGGEIKETPRSDGGGEGREADGLGAGGRNIFIILRTRGGGRGKKAMGIAMQGTRK